MRWFVTILRRVWTWFGRPDDTRQRIDRARASALTAEPRSMGGLGTGHGGIGPQGPY